MAYIKVESGEPVERTIKRFKRMVEREGTIREWKRREYYEKPSTIRNRKKKAAKGRIRKKMRRQYPTVR